MANGYWGKILRVDGKDQGFAPGGWQFSHLTSSGRVIRGLKCCLKRENLHFFATIPGLGFTMSHFMDGMPNGFKGARATP